eukprot:TRINITY_DN6173_c0_g1_i1.p1 TRINITY_DN6173_c0_g1~~TRINITY_DN6173_c0_g1_i1.p1  ORF type:complete len:189 (-),score=17.19 TRINITY_DN6173_c0_g1_i1:135-701(-)
MSSHKPATFRRNLKSTTTSIYEDFRVWFFLLYKYLYKFKHCTHSPSFTKHNPSSQSPFKHHTILHTNNKVQTNTSKMVKREALKGRIGRSVENLEGITEEQKDTLIHHCTTWIDSDAFNQFLALNAHTKPFLSFVVSRGLERMGLRHQGPGGAHGVTTDDICAAVDCGASALRNNKNGYKEMIYNAWP